MQKVSWENTLRVRRANSESLLQDKQKQQDTTNNPKSNFLSSTPVVEIASKVDCHDQGCECTDVQHHAEIVYLQQLLFEPAVLLGISTREEEDVNWSEGTADAEVDVEGPSPGRAGVFRECTANTINCQY
jgi:hypothetical protein